MSLLHWSVEEAMKCRLLFRSEGVEGSGKPPLLFILFPLCKRTFSMGRKEKKEPKRIRRIDNKRNKGKRKKMERSRSSRVRYSRAAIAAAHLFKYYTSPAMGCVFTEGRPKYLSAGTEDNKRAEAKGAGEGGRQYFFFFTTTHGWGI